MVKWIVEHIFDDDQKRLVQSLEKLGIEYHIASHPVYSGDWKSLASPDDCVVTHGSIQFGRMVQRESQWIPGHYCSGDSYKCSVYYPKFGGDLLNYNYMMFPFEELPNKIDFIYDTLGIEDVVFIRPDTGMKSFTGQMVYRERFAQEYDKMGIFSPDPHSICLVCEPRNLEKEWRFFVSDGQIITGSEYKPEKITINKNHSAWAIAQGFVNNAQYEPDPIWCIDICRTTNNNYYVLEIGSFSSAGLYACDTDLIVPIVNNLAIKEWQEYHVETCISRSEA